MNWVKTVIQPRLLKHELRLIIRRPSFMAIYALLLMASIAAVIFGQSSVDTQLNIQHSAAQQHEAALSYAQTVNDTPLSTGYAAYLLQLPTFSAAQPEAALSNGIRTFAPYSLPLRTLAIESQIDNQGVLNPLRAYIGAFDLAFVLSMVFPLALIALCATVRTEEKETGRWLIARQDRGLLLRRTGVRTFGLLSCATLALLFASFYADVSSQESMLIWLPAFALYLLFWLCAVLVAQRLSASSEFSALISLSLWVFLAILVPTLADLIAQRSHPAEQGPQMVMEHRQYLNGAWDRPRQDTIDTFVQNHPEFSEHALRNDKFTWAWYFAMQDDADRHITSLRCAMRQDIEGRRSWMPVLGAINPVIAIQSFFQRRAKTDLGAYIAYRDAMRTYHRQTLSTLYPAIWSDSPFDAEYAKQVKLFENDDQGTTLKTTLNCGGYTNPDSLIKAGES